MAKVRVLIADDHALLRDGLARVLQFESDIEVVGEAASGQDALERACSLKPDVLLLDLNMPGMSGIQVITKLGEACPEVKVVVLTAHDDDAYVIDAFRAGASAYVLKDAGGSEIAETIRTVHQGGYFIYPKVLKTVMREFVRLSRAEPNQGAHGPGQAGPEDQEPLTDREREILGLLANGSTNRDIAQKLFISEKTVKNHVSSILRKLGLEHRTQAAVYAVRTRTADGE